MFIKVIFKRGTGVWSRLIEWRTKGEYSHCEIWFDGPSDKAFVFSSIEGTGTRFTTLDLTGKIKWDVISITEDASSTFKLYRFALSMVGKKYDWIGLLNFGALFKIFHSNVHDSNDRFCSEICYESLVETGWLQDNKGAWKISPNELAVILASKFGSPQPVDSK